MVELTNDDCLVAMKGIPENSVEAIVTDTPYELGFMGKKWDASGIAYNVDMWKGCLRVLKPGGHLLSFGGTRTYHRMACAIEDAGFEIRDMVEWVYGSGFPKSLSIGKAIDKLQGNERETILVPSKAGNSIRRGQGEQGSTYGDGHGGFTDISKGTSEWEGWGTATKPAHEPILVCTKPLTLENIYGILSLDITENLRRYICQKSSASAKDVEKSLRSILHRLEKAGVNTVAENVKTYVLENTESVSIAAVSSILHRRRLKEQTGENKEGSAPDDAKENGNEGLLERRVPTGKTEPLSGLMDMLQLMLGGTTIDLNMLSSWKNILGDLLSGAKKTSTIEMALKTTTELKTLNCYLSANISGFTGPGLDFTPNHNPICLARKPLSEKTVAENVLKWGTGGLNIDGSRVEADIKNDPNYRPNASQHKGHGSSFSIQGDRDRDKSDLPDEGFHNSLGRFPANLIHDGSEEVQMCFPETKSGGSGQSKEKAEGANCYGVYSRRIGGQQRPSAGSAARFFKSIIYQAKASKAERGEGNNHPTVKSLKLMEYLINMVTREGDTVLDPFMGSGTTGVACQKQNRNFIGIEKDEGYFEIAKQRLSQDVLNFE